MYMPLLLKILYWSSPVLLLPLLCLMVWKRFYRKRPLFFAYVIYEILSISLVLLVQHQYALYFYVIWYIIWADDILTLLVIGEIYREALERYPTLQAVGTRLFFAATMVLLAASVLIAMSVPGISPDFSRRVSALVVIHRSVLLLQAGLILLLVVFTLSLALPWRGFAKGIALGLGLATALQGIPQSLFSAHLIGRGVYDLVYACGYPCGVVVWLVTGLRALVFTPAEQAIGPKELETLRRSLNLPPKA